jgi:hypothetical protein
MRLRPLVILAFVLALPTRADDPATLTFVKDVQPLLQTYCFDCHGGDKHKGDVSLAPFKDDQAVQSDPKLWRAVLGQLGDYTMPPKTKPQPSMAERQQLIAWVTYRLDNLDLSKLPKDPGRVTLHRLNRQEYNNTLRDLLGVYTRPADAFPADGGGGGGFDNNADTLFLPPVLMELYLKAAGDAVGSADRRFLYPGGRPDEGNRPKRDVARQNIERLVTRAFRRPAKPPRSTATSRSSTAPTSRGRLRSGAEARVQGHPRLAPFPLPRRAGQAGVTEPYTINDYELASRLSYFLWASMPDDELIRLAGENKLHDDATLDAQVRRMLKDPRARALAEYFGMQWLGVTALHTTANPDRTKFPEFTTSIRDAFYEQAIAFVDSVFRQDLPVTTLIDSDYTYVNKELARFYGLERPKVKDKEDDMQRIALTDKTRARGGVPRAWARSTPSPLSRSAPAPSSAANGCSIP